VVEDQQESPKKKEPIIDEKENNKIEEKVENDQKKVMTVDELSDTKEAIKTDGQKKQQGKMKQRSLRSKDDYDVNQLAFGCGDLGNIPTRTSDTTLTQIFRYSYSAKNMRH